MRSPVVMPSLSEDTDEGIVVAWFAQPGAHVAAGELIAQVQVEKGADDVHAPAAGWLAEIVVPAGQPFPPFPDGTDCAPNVYR